MLSQRKHVLYIYRQNKFFPDENELVKVPDVPVFWRLCPNHISISNHTVGEFHGACLIYNSDNKMSKQLRNQRTYVKITVCQFLIGYCVCLTKKKKTGIGWTWKIPNTGFCLTGPLDHTVLYRVAREIKTNSVTGFSGINLSRAKIPGRWLNMGGVF